MGLFSYLLGPWSAVANPSTVCRAPTVLGTGWLQSWVRAWELDPESAETPLM